MRIFKQITNLVEIFFFIYYFDFVSDEADDSVHIFTGHNGNYMTNRFFSFHFFTCNLLLMHLSCRYVLGFSLMRCQWLNQYCSTTTTIYMKILFLNCFSFSGGKDFSNLVPLEISNMKFVFENFWIYKQTNCQPLSDKLSLGWRKRNLCLYK